MESIQENGAATKIKANNELQPITRSTSLRKRSALVSGFRSDISRLLSMSPARPGVIS